VYLASYLANGNIDTILDFRFVSVETMELLERKQKWVLYDDAGFVVIIASDVKICRSIMRRALREKSKSVK
jgi:hypothetical protein